jgi:hypothetical protein
MQPPLMIERARYPKAASKNGPDVIIALLKAGSKAKARNKKDTRRLTMPSTGTIWRALRMLDKATK